MLQRKKIQDILYAKRTCSLGSKLVAMSCTKNWWTLTSVRGVLFDSQACSDAQ